MKARAPWDMPTPEQWLSEARERLQKTEEEIEVFERSTREWEAVYRTSWPGAGYAATMRAQRERQKREIENAEQSRRS